MTTYVVDPGLGRRRFSYTPKGILELMERYLTALGELPGEWENIRSSKHIYQRIKQPTDPGLKTFQKRVCVPYLVESVIYVQVRDGTHAVIRVQPGGNATRTVQDGAPGPTGIQHIGKLQTYLRAAELHLNTPTSPSKTLGIRPRAYKSLTRRWDAVTTLHDEDGKRFRLYRRIAGFTLTITAS